MPKEGNYCCLQVYKEVSEALRASVAKNLGSLCGKTFCRILYLIFVKNWNNGVIILVSSPLVLVRCKVLVLISDGIHLGSSSRFTSQPERYLKRKLWPKIREANNLGKLLFFQLCYARLLRDI